MPAEKKKKKSAVDCEWLTQPNDKRHDKPGPGKKSTPNQTSLLLCSLKRQCSLLRRPPALRKAWNPPSLTFCLTGDTDGKMDITGMDPNPMSCCRRTRRTWTCPLRIGPEKRSSSKGDSTDLREHEMFWDRSAWVSGMQGDSRQLCFQPPGSIR